MPSQTRHLGAVVGNYPTCLPSRIPRHEHLGDHNFSSFDMYCPSPSPSDNPILSDRIRCLDGASSACFTFGCLLDDQFFDRLRLLGFLSISIVALIIEYAYSVSEDYSIVFGHERRVNLGKSCSVQIPAFEGYAKVSTRPWLQHFLL